MKITRRDVYLRPGLIATEKAVLTLNGEFVPQVIHPLTVAIMEYNMLPEEHQPEYITLMINSPGGAVHVATQLIDIMRTSKIPVHTQGFGMIASCGIITLMAGAKGHRSVTENSMLMSHTWSGSAQGNSHDLQAANERHQHTSNLLMKLYKQFTGQTEETIKEHLMGYTDKWLTPDQAVEYGIVDTVKKVS